jgi:hypothetical protein
LTFQENEDLFSPDFCSKISTNSLFFLCYNRFRRFLNSFGFGFLLFRFFDRANSLF